MPRKKKTEASVYEKPEAENAAPVATTAPKGAPKRKRGRKAKAEEPATQAAEGATPAPTLASEVDDDPFRDIPLAECDLPQPQPVPEDAAPVPAPAPRRKKATKQATKKPTRDTDADKAASAATATDTDLTMADLGDQFLKHLEDAGKSRGTVFSYSIDLGLAIKHFGESTKLSSLTAKKVTNFYESDLVTKTRTGKGKAQPTILKTRRVLRLALVWAAEVGIIAEAPLP